MSSEIPSRIEALRSQMTQNGIEAYIVPHSDPHQSEYLAGHWDLIPWISGFTGSAGTLVVTMKYAGLWTDSRYFIQAEKELQNSGIKLFKDRLPETPDIISWLCEKLEEENAVGLDGTLFTNKQIEKYASKFQKHNIQLKPRLDLISPIWAERPPKPLGKIYIHEAKFSDQHFAQKHTDLIAALDEIHADFFWVSALDEIAWLLNLRGSDISYNPVFIAYLLISENKNILFIDEDKLHTSVKFYLERNGVEIRAYSDVEISLQEIAPGNNILLPQKQTSFKIRNSIPKGVKVLEDDSPIQLRKAQKTTVEVDHIREAMIQDGVALTSFFMWLEAEVSHRPVSEVEAGEKLYEFRSQQEHFVGESFSPIVGYMSNGAIVHYSARPGEDAQILPDGMLLIDSGGQYLNGTTDITRTIACGPVSEQMKSDFTKVLKGHIQLAIVVFPEGTSGLQLDVLARRNLWESGLNFGHGTGHGVGYFLNVHEGPQSISASRLSAIHPLKPGMLTSNEPGLYRTGEYGIRIENLVLTTEHSQTEFGQFLHFETLTLFPIDLSLVVKSIMDQSEVEWLNQYHEKVYIKLSPHLNEQARIWLFDKTRAL